MNFFSKKNNQQNSIEDEKRRNSLIHWGTVIGVLVTIIVIMVINFYVISRNEAVDLVKEQLITKSNAYASDIAHKLEGTYGAANVVAGIMSDKEKCNASDIAWYADQLQKSQENTYMVVIADNNGDGYTNEYKKVNISDTSYFGAPLNPRYMIIEDDGIMHKEACVVIVPYYQEHISKGSIYMFISAEDIEEMLPLAEYDLKGSFVICDSRGTFLGAAGAETVFLENDQFVEHLNASTYMDENNNVSRILTRFANMWEFTFEAQYKGEMKTFVSVPLGISDWQYVTILNQDYVERQIAGAWANERTLTIELAVAAAVFVILAITVTLVNRLHYTELNKELEDKADTDLLTGLNNKIATERKIQEYIEQNPDKQCLFFLFDIDNFKKINDTLGHAFGDEVLRSLGRQLSNEFRITDIIGRTGGDEFILFLKDLGTDEVLEKEAKRFADFFRSFQAGEYVKYSATSSIGATVFPRDAKDYHGLYTTADSALYEAKRRGKNQMVFYNKDLEAVNPDSKRVTPIDSDMR